MIVTPTPAPGLELEQELLDAYVQLDAARLAYTAAQVRYRAVLDQIEARDREESHHVEHAHDQA